MADEPDRAGLQRAGLQRAGPRHRAGLLSDCAGLQRAGPRQHLQIFDSLCPELLVTSSATFILLGWRCRSSHEEQQFQRLSPYSSGAAGRPEDNSFSGSYLSRAATSIVSRRAAVSVALIVVEWRRQSSRRRQLQRLSSFSSDDADRLTKSSGFGGSHLS